MEPLDELVAAVLRSPKYRAVCPHTVRRLGRAELAKGRSVKHATKATRRRLHQVFGAFRGEPRYPRLLAAVRAAARRGSEDELRQACRRALGQHASTRERLPLLDAFYRRLFALTGVPRRVLDLACGLHPLGLPWMGLPREAPYAAFDIDGRAVDFLNRCFAAMGVGARAEHRDVLCSPPEGPADVAFLLKTFPCLERQERGAGWRLVEAVGARHVVVSFPVASLGGREKGMREHYERSFLAAASGAAWPVERLEFAAELVFVVSKS
ncbi:MAG: Rmt family 16S rRNA (guanine(1405)-N(7))-methyltransferase [bacterium]